MEKIKTRLIGCVKSVTPGALRTSVWLVKIMFCVTFGITLLKYFGVIQWISVYLTPLFSHFGLPGQAALAYVSGFFVNCYSAIAVMISLNLDARSTTLLAIMVLCAHNMFIETAVQKKTGTSAFRIVFVRTLSSLFLGWVLNKILPGESVYAVESLEQAQRLPFLQTLWHWLLDTLRMAIPMVLLVFSLTVVQRILSEFGVIRFVARFLRPVMRFFGLPPKTAFLWIVANTLGLAYGAGIMLDEVKQGKVSLQEADLLNNHICISHSNLEDLLLFTSIGGLLLWMLLSRWVMSFFWVWERRLENLIKQKAATKSNRLVSKVGAK